MLRIDWSKPLKAVAGNATARYVGTYKATNGCNHLVALQPQNSVYEHVWNVSDLGYDESGVGRVIQAPRILTRWLNLYDSGTDGTIYESKASADDAALRRHPQRWIETREIKWEVPNT